MFPSAEKVRARRSSGVRLNVEQLESREVPHAVSGGAWAHSELVTISFVPDGTVLTYDSQGQPITSTLFADFNARWSQTTWQNAILKGAQVWARQTNLNFSVVPDDGSEVGQLGQFQQGAPNYGDIRIGGAHYASRVGATMLAQAYLPPALNNWSIAGDIQFNTDAAYNVGATFDLFTVAAHEIGHALGMEHSSDPNAVMYSAYPGLKTDLTADDVAGIRQIYSSGQARSADAYDAGAGNNSFSTATNLTLDPVTKTALVTDLDITTTSDGDFFKFTIPSGAVGTLSVKVKSAGQSLLAPKVYLYNSSFMQRGFANGAGQLGATLSINLTGIAAGQVYYVRVVGADASAFGTGKYALTLNAGTGADPIVPTADTQTATGESIATSGTSALVPDQLFGSEATKPRMSPGRDHDAGTVASGIPAPAPSVRGRDIELDLRSGSTAAIRGAAPSETTDTSENLRETTGRLPVEDEITELDEFNPLARRLAAWLHWLGK